MLARMTRIRALLATFAILTPVAAMAAAPAPLGPNKGVFSDWTAATYGTGSAKICYAFTKPQSSHPALSRRGPAMLTITERHGSRDEVSLTPGFTYAKKPAVSLLAGKTKIPFYVEDNTAFTDDVPEALAAFARESTTTVTSTGPKGSKISDQFSLSGFSAAYKAISKACP
jgi:hypothetical protein